jgi:ribokinase
LNAAPARPVAPDLLGKAEADLDAATAALDLLHLGPRAVIVTLGGDGLVLAGAGTTSHLPANAVTVVLTHGAGNAFIGALAAEWARGASLGNAAAFGQAAAALLVSAAVDDRASIDVAAIRALQAAR